MRTFLLCLLRPMLFLLARPRAAGGTHLPRHGPAILASNHNSHLDTLVILSQFSLGSAHLVRPVAAADHFIKSPLSDWFYRHIVGVVAVDRRRADKGPAVLNECRAALTRGEILLIYPEGTRGDSERLGPLKGGIARLAMEFPDAPVIPVYVHGTRHVLPKDAVLPTPGACTVTFGRSLSWDGSRRRFMAMLRAALERLQSDRSRIGRA
jgi:1-acyl-sn-glycerol-3-phosphate acyltransferase